MAEMNEETYAAFHRISELCIASAGDQPKNDLITLGKAVGASEKYLQDEFEELFESEDSAGSEIELEIEEEEQQEEDPTGYDRVHDEL